MAVSAFKSSSRRTTAQNSNSSGSGERDSDKKPPPPKRSRSVSAYTRRSQQSQQQPEVISSDFLIKRDNPLFCRSDGSVRDGDFGDGAWKERVLGLGDDVRKINGGGGVGSGGRKGTGEGLGVRDGRRGRSVSRDAVAGSELAGIRKSVGRSLSRVDTMRRNRSVSQNPVSRGYNVSSESELEQDGHSLSGSNKGVSNSKMVVRAADRLDILDPMKNLRTWSSQHPVTELQYDSATSLACSRDDGASTGSLSGVEEKTIRAVSEQKKSERVDDLIANSSSGSIYETVQSEVRRAILDIQNDLESALRTSGTTTIVGSNLADISPNLVNPGAIGLVMDIRSEYSKKLEESQERSRKLRADLAVEEYRMQELSRILKDILPEPRTSVQKTRPARKASIERRRMSKRLTEEAMAYFDECVSLSTFDSSDFSSAEDPLLHSAGDTYPLSEPFTDEPLRHCEEYSRLADCSADKHETDPYCSNSNNSDLSSLGNKLSLSRKASKYTDLPRDIKNFLKRSSDDSAKDDKGITGSLWKGHYLVEAYSFLATNECSLSERVTYKKRLESGGLLLCGGTSFSPFGSFI